MWHGDDFVLFLIQREVTLCSWPSARAQQAFEIDFQIEDSIDLRKHYKSS